MSGPARSPCSEGEELTADHVMASACLPMVFQAVEIDGEPYWDGGYMGNPALFPLFYKAHCDDILLVQINPIERKELPTKAREIQEPPERDHLQRLAAARTARDRFRQPADRRGKLPRGTGPGQYRRINVHRIVLDRFGTAFRRRQQALDRLRFLRNAAHRRQARRTALPR